MPVLKIIKYTFTAIGVAMLVIAFIWVDLTSDFIKSAQLSTGEVIELVREKSTRGSSSTSSGSYVYRPVVRFPSDLGDVIVF
ncbi:hypothetical protein [Kiloniella antarctica]|uniref:Uncharacterized protein n=1 Tax=Kiloniella antarctica TaxID=1550907 RepID=A0ABW5BHK6_9PROT